MQKQGQRAYRKVAQTWDVAAAVSLELDAATAAQIAILRLRDGLSMAEYQKRAVEAYALMMPGGGYR